MMTKEQAEAVKMVYARFFESEECHLTDTRCGWNEIDDNLEFVGFLNDKEMVAEAHVKYLSHSKNGIFKCYQTHAQEYCLAPHLLEAVGGIISLFEKTGELHIRNRYVLNYYIAMSEMKMIFLV
jgi:hypothetical protein